MVTRQEIEGLIERLRKDRDATPQQYGPGELRSDYNAAIDRLEVLAGRLYELAQPERKT